ncbi:MAG TPA: TetR/AcrR family transcriptional regulator [Anaerolineales bacterium]|nr:TetR/AcrR family transcriptional regulator [Anaerolineales bacterium]
MDANEPNHGGIAVHTSDSILEAGEFLFQRQGFHGTSVRQLARFAGITPAAIYNHFPSKEDIFIALLKARLPHRILALAVQQAQGETASTLLLDGVRRMHGAMAGRIDNLRLLLVELLEFEGRHLPQVLPEIMAPGLSFLERLRSTDPRLGAWSPPLLFRLIGGAFFAFAVTESYLGQAEWLNAGPQDYDDLAAILAAGLLGAQPQGAASPGLGDSPLDSAPPLGAGAPSTAEPSATPPPDPPGAP